MWQGRPFNQNSLLGEKKKKEKKIHNHLLGVTQGFLQETHDYLLIQVLLWSQFRKTERATGRSGRDRAADPCGRGPAWWQHGDAALLVFSTGHPLREWPPHTTGMAHTHSPTLLGRKAIALQREKVFAATAATPKRHVLDSSCPLRIHAPSPTPSPAHNPGAAMQLAPK